MNEDKELEADLRKPGWKEGKRGEKLGWGSPKFDGQKNSETDGRTDEWTDGCATYGGIETTEDVLKHDEIFALKRNQSGSFLEAL